MRTAPAAAIIIAAALSLALGGCGGRPGGDRPNIIVVVWDCARADHLGLYGYEKPTTPFLDRWALGARVYEDCLSAANYCAGSQASILTGLIPRQHGVRNDSLYLPARCVTMAEVLRGAGYRTYLYSANPYISTDRNFAQGFSRAEHPWDDRYRRLALRIVESKLDPGDTTSELHSRVREGRFLPWDIKASGTIIRDAALEWLRIHAGREPFFVYLDYMEAHRPCIPPRAYRERIMPAAELACSYTMDRSGDRQWAYTFGLSEYTEEELAATRGTYDAALAELDELFAGLIASLEMDGFLKNTIVILTADHGEHLGEHHMMGHHYSLYHPLLRVPLIIRYPEKFSPGRETGPVVNYDLFPTLLELAGVDPPAGPRGGALSLLEPAPGRFRVAESPGAYTSPFEAVKEHYPSWEPGSWTRELRALVDGPRKFIWASDGRHELYRLDDDPEEEENLVEREPELASRLAQEMEAFTASIAPER